MSGYNPPTRNRYWSLKQQHDRHEKSRSTAIMGVGIAFKPTTMQDLYPSADSDEQSSGSDDDNEIKGRIGPAQLKCLDRPVTHEESIKLLQKKLDEKT